MPIYTNIGGAQKPLKELYANINGVQKKIFPLYANIGGVQKNLLGYEWAKYHVAYKRDESYEENYHLIPEASDGSVAITELSPTLDQSAGLLKYVYNINYPLYTQYMLNLTGTRGSSLYFFGNELGSATADMDLIQSGVKYAYYIRESAEITNRTDYFNVSELIIYSSSVSTTEHGEFIEYVKSDVESAYPDNGIQDGYWYIRQ